MNDESLFHQARERPLPERGLFLDEACAGDEARRRRVEALLQADNAPGSFLQSPVVKLAATADADPHAAAGEERGPWVRNERAPPEECGRIIGPYKLLQQIGEGGMGAVFMAEQTQPVQRKVALKLIKAGMDSRQVIARFEAERQALALMDHPNIAQVLDAGETPDGRPYFVMELVKGVPITRYCDEQRLTPRQRLELFIPLCQALQHAHHKGIIHRDLKPSNVLVAPHDGKPVVKVIDFGVAKATGQRLTEKTLFTEFGSVVGTLEYMSPEQAELNNQDIDTRSDLYSLGVLLYELLTGTTPLDPARLKQAAFTEMLRRVREEEPPRPSMRLSESKDSLPSISAQRHTEPAKLTRLVRGELDWIVMKALEKDRDRRYETANGFAADVLRYLADEPVQACPPSAWYRFRKFSRRNKVALTTGTLVAAALLLGAAMSLWQAFRASDALEAKLWEEARANQARADERLAQIALDQEQIEKERQKARVEHEQARVNRDLAAALVEATRLQVRAKAGDLEAKRAWTNLRETAKRAEALAGSQLADAVLVRQVQTLLAQTDQDETDRQMLAKLEDLRLNPDPDNIPGGAIINPPKYVKRDNPYLAPFREYGLPVLDMQVEEAAQKIAASAIRDSLAIALDDWAYQTREPKLLVIAQKVYDDPWRRQYFQARLGNDRAALQQLARQPEALKYPELLAHLHRSALGATSMQLMLDAQARQPGNYWLNSFFASNGHLLRYPGEDIGFLRAALALRPDSPTLYFKLGNLLQTRGRLDDGITMLEHCIRLQPDHPWAPAYLSVYRGLALEKKGKLDEAFLAYQEALRLRPGYLGAYECVFRALERKQAPAKAFLEYLPGYQKVGRNSAAAYYHLGDVLCKWGKEPEAIEAYVKALQFDPGFESVSSALREVTLYQLLIKTGRLDQAIADWREDLVRQSDVNGRVRVFYTLGVVLEKSGRLDEAIAAWEQCVAQPGFTGHGAIWVRFGDTLAGADKLDRAAAAYRKARDASYWPATKRLVNVLARAGRLEEAIKACRELARDSITVRDSADAYEQLFGLLDQGGRLEEAAPVYRDAVRVLPAKDLLAMASRFAEKKQPALAIVIYQEAVRANPKDWTVRLSLAQALEKQGRFGEAIAVLRGASRVGPELPAVIQAVLKKDLSTKGKAADVLAVYRVALNFNSAAGLSSLGDALLKINLLDEAIVAWREAIRLDPRFLAPYLQLAAAEEKEGRPEKASAVLRDALRAWPDLPPLFQPLLKEEFARKAKPAQVLAVYLAATTSLRKSATDYLGLAQRLTTLGLLDEAVPVWQEVIRLDPNLLWAYQQLAALQDKRGLLDEAIAAWHETVHRDPKNTFAFEQLALALEKKGLRDEAVLAWRKVIKLQPDLPTAYLQLVKLFLQSGNLDAVICLKTDPRWPQEACDLLQTRGLLDKGIAACREGLGKRPDEVRFHAVLALALDRQVHLKEALPAYSAWVRLEPRNTEALLRRGALHRQLGQKDQALADFSRATEVAPEQALVWLNRANYYVSLRQWDKAAADYSRLIVLNPRDAAAWHGRSNAYFQLQLWDKVAADCTQGIALLPQNYSLWFMRGVAFSHLGQYEKSVADHSRAIELYPNYALAWSNRAVALEQLGRWERAAADYAKIEELRSATPAVLAGWARCQSRLGRYPEALAKLEKASPFAEVLTELAWQLATCPDARYRNPPRAVLLAGRFAKAFPNEGAHWNTLGAAHYAAGDWKAAVEALTKSMKLRQGGDSRDGFFLAMAQEKLGNRAEARKQFDRAVEWLDKHRPNDPELRRFRAEAAAVLGLEKDGPEKERPTRYSMARRSRSHSGK